MYYTNSGSVHGKPAFHVKGRSGEIGDRKSAPHYVERDCTYTTCSAFAQDKTAVLITSAACYGYGTR